MCEWDLLQFKIVFISAFWCQDYATVPLIPKLPYLSFTSLQCLVTCQLTYMLTQGCRQEFAFEVQVTMKQFWRKRDKFNDVDYKSKKDELP